MPRQVKTLVGQIALPTGLTYPINTTVVLTDEQYSRLQSTIFTDGKLADQGPIGLGANPSSGLASTLDAPTSGVYRSSFDRAGITTDVAAALTTAVMTSTAVAVTGGDVATSITVPFGATAGATMTNWWFALYSSTGALLAQTADQTSGAIAALSVKDLPLVGGPITFANSGVCWIGVMVKATTVPSCLCRVAPVALAYGAIAAGQAVLAQTSGSALTATAPATIATPTTVVNRIFAFFH